MATSSPKNRSEPNPKIDGYLGRLKSWQKEMTAMRDIALGSGLVEEMKWGKPCYSLDATNVFLLHEFKDYCAMLFFKGALLKDAKGLLVQQTANVQAARQLRFTSLSSVTAAKATIKTYIAEAIEVEKAGLKVVLKPTAAFAVPEEFQKQLDNSSALEEAFAALTPGRQRAYLLHFSSAKQSKTREARVETCRPRILEGKGLDND